jgi:hypothetical protein
VALAAVALACAATPALETDPYMVLDVELADAAPQLNRYVNDVIERRLERMNRRLSEGRGEALLCPEAVDRVFGGFKYMRASGWAQHSPELDRHPDDDVSGLEYYRESVLGMPYYAYFMVPLARTINIGGVYVSTDKIGHFFAFGQRYHRRYRRARARGLDHGDAVRKVILWGVKKERTVQGRTSTGIFSGADLEANYQGLRLALDLCGPGGSARLVRSTEGYWTLRGGVELRDYVNPDWDEAFNSCFYTKRRWKRIRARMEAHCDKLRADVTQERFRRYAETYAPSASALVIAELEQARRLPRREAYLLESVCRDDRTADSVILSGSSAPAPGIR